MFYVVWTRKYPILYQYRRILKKFAPHIKFYVDIGYLVRFLFSTHTHIPNRVLTAIHLYDENTYIQYMFVMRALPYRNINIAGAAHKIIMYMHCCELTYLLCCMYNVLMYMQYF